MPNHQQQFIIHGGGKANACGFWEIVLHWHSLVVGSEPFTKVFDFKCMNKGYWAALASRLMLADRGCSQIVRGQLQIYYRALLAVPNPGELPLRLKALAYEQLIGAAKAGEPMPELLALRAPPLVPIFGAQAGRFYI